jgi:hypothetical protein
VADKPSEQGELVEFDHGVLTRLVCSTGEKGEDQPEDEGTPGPGARMQQGIFNLVVSFRTSFWENKNSN